MDKQKIFLFSLMIMLSAIEYGQSSFIFTDHIEKIGLIDQQIYAQCVYNLPICCVDIMIYNQANNRYLMIERKLPPAQGTLFFPGGRLYKGESFFDCARRKCLEEVGLKVEPSAVIDVYSTIYPDSAWNCQAHTINIAVLAMCTLEDAQAIMINHEHGDYVWVALDSMPEDTYLNEVHKKAVIVIRKLLKG